MTLEEFRNKIVEIDFFGRGSENEQFVHSLWKICKQVSYRRGQRIIKEGEKGKSMYIGLSGAVKIQQLTRAGDSYTIAHVDCSDNIFFGELALIDDDKRSATVIAEVPSTFLTISQKEFNKICETYPREGLYILRKLLKRVSTALRKSTRNMVLLFDTLIKEIEE